MALDASVGTICWDCAKVNGAVWPDGHVATIWTGDCDVCGNTVAVCDVSDWNWPKGKKPLLFNLFNRD